ncbi:uncharacterized protein LOC142170151 [Nicotiana tabacum]|uniref:Uncharacterized protein LOC142170151 n=1 Tax=Nicotiana tabacum TaxID=4097 RepID=A0AC58SSY9_TOBAC
MSINEDVVGSPVVASMSTELVDHNHPLYIHPFDTQGTCTKIKYDTSLHELWDRCNVIVLAWIMNTVSPSLISSVIYAFDTYTVWTDLKERFDKDNASRACYLHKEIATLTQGISSVSVYYTKLRELWDEYKISTPPPTCGCAESRKHVDHYQIQKLYQFLTGLNESDENAKNQSS